MIRIYKEFATEADAIAFREAMYTSYHPCGYSTFIKVEKSSDGTRWIASGSRAASCD